MKSIKLFNNKDNNKVVKISLIKVNKKDNFNTANIFIKKQKYKPKRLFNQSNDFSSYISPKINNDYLASHRIKTITNKNDISNDEINIMRLKMSCNILNHKINQLRNFSKEIESHSYDNIKNNISNSEINININNRNEYLRRNDNYLSYMNNQQNFNQRNKLNNLDLSYSSKNYFCNPKLSLNDENSFNGISKINLNNRKKYSFTSFNNHINNINKISKINNMGINNKIIRKKNISKIYRPNGTDINLFNDIERFNETDTQLKNIPDLIKIEKRVNNDNDNDFNKNISFNKKDTNNKPPFYNKIINNNYIFHKRFNSHGINNISDINYKSQNIDINQYKNNLNNCNIQKIKYFEKKNENKYKNRVGYFDNFFLKNKNLYFIENSCNYNIVNQNSIQNLDNNNINNNLQIQESSKITYFNSKDKISNNINKDNNSINERIKKDLNIRKENNLIQVYSNNFTIKGKELDRKNIINNNKEDNKYNSKNTINNINSEKIKEKENINKEKIQENNKLENITKENKNYNEIIKDSKKDIDDIINIEKDNISSNFLNKNNADGKIITTDSEKDKELNNKINNNILNINEPNKNRIILNKENEKENEKEESQSKSEDEIFKILLEKIKQNKEVSKKIEEEKKKVKKKKVFFDNELTNYILYDLNKPVTKIMIYDNKGKLKKFNSKKTNEYINKLKYSNISKYKKFKTNLKNCPNINYKKLIEDTNNNMNKTEKNNKIKNIKISSKSNNLNNSLKGKNRLYSICDDIIKSIDPLSVTERNLNKKENSTFNKHKKSNNMRKNKLMNSYEDNKRKINKEKNNSFDLTKKKAKEKILNPIDDIRKYFEEMY